MRKLKLELEALEVESFELSERDRDAQGTVHGNVVSGVPGECSMSMQFKCFQPQDTITADVWAGECNTTQCPAGSGLSCYGCNTDFLC